MNKQNLVYLTLSLTLAGISLPMRAMSTLKQTAFFMTYLVQETHRRLWTDYKQDAPFKLKPSDLKPAEIIAQSLQTKYSTNPSFLIGASTSEHQCSNKCTPHICSWARFASQLGISESTDEKYRLSQKNLWDNYREFIDKANELGMNSLRVSVEWALVQPKKPWYSDKKNQATDLLADEHFDKTALDHYAQMVTYMIEKGITPIICFHHYTDPCWFLDLDEQFKTIKRRDGTKVDLPLGGFEHRENIPYFTAFCTKVYTHIMNTLATNEITQDRLRTMHPPLWATFNSPTGYAFKGYQKVNPADKRSEVHHAQGPTNNPDKLGHQWTMEVLGTMMHAHVNVYESLHAAYKAHKSWSALPSPQVGLMHNVHQLRAYKKFYSPIICMIGEMLQHESFYQFFENGHFRAYIPGLVNVSIRNKKAPYSLDWIGVNCYSDGLMDGAQKVPYTHADRKTDNANYYRNGQCLGRALLEVGERIAIPVGKRKADKKPLTIYVTENGIATRDPEHREIFYKEYLNAVAQSQNKLAKKGVRVGGYLTWSLMDNYEWPSFKNTEEPRKKYGLLKIKKDGTIIPKDGIAYYKTFAHALTRPLPVATV